MRAPRARRATTARPSPRARCTRRSSPPSTVFMRRSFPPVSYELIKLEEKGRVGLITLNRPKQLNALSPQLMQELGAALQAYDANEGIGAIVITGNDKAFAAGADIA